MADAEATQLPYLIVAAVLAVLAVVIWRARLPELGAATRRVNAEARKHLSLWRHRNLVLGVVAIFIHLIAEIGVGNLFISFASQPDIGNVTHEQAGELLEVLWGGMADRPIPGAFIMRAIAPEKVLAGFSIGAFLVMMIASFAHGPTAMYGLMAVGFFHSIMFPTIFALAIRGLGPLTEEGSGWLIWAIAGGALVIRPGQAGRSVRDSAGHFCSPRLCELYRALLCLVGRATDPRVAPEQLSTEGAGLT